MNTEVRPNANMLSWAITRAGYNLPEFTARFPKVESWLAGIKYPTIKQLEEFSHKVHLPFGYLFLDHPPQEQLSFPFFRTGRPETKSVSLNIYDTILLIQKRQDWLVDYLIDNEYESLHFVGKFNNVTDPVSIARNIKKTLGLEPEWASKCKNWNDALDFLSKKIEEAGIMMTFNSVVENNNHRQVNVEECRGFVLVNKFAPFMFINAGDGKAAQMFTIAHELAHIWIGASAGFDMHQMLPANDPIELLSDKVAAEFLVPTDSFITKWNESADIMTLARYFKVSPIVLARRALDTGKITKSSFFKWYADYKSESKEKKENISSGGDFYATQRKRLGLRYVAFVDKAVREQQLLYRDAYKLTGLKGDTYENFIAKHF